MATGQAIGTQAARIGKLILIQTEIMPSLWLMSGIDAARAFRAAMGFFAGAAVVNLRSIWSDEGSCVCYGPIEVSPAIPLLINCVQT